MSDWLIYRLQDGFMFLLIHGWETLVVLLLGCVVFKVRVRQMKELGDE